MSGNVSFAVRFKAMRRNIIDPETNRPITQRRLAERIGVDLRTIQNYEWGATLPHAIIRREIARMFPDAFGRL